MEDVRIFVNAGERAASRAEGVYRNGHAVMAAGAEPGCYFPFFPVASREGERARVMVRCDDDQGTGVF